MNIKQLVLYREWCLEHDDRNTADVLWIRIKLLRERDNG